MQLLMACKLDLKSEFTYLFQHLGKSTASRFHVKFPDFEYCKVDRTIFDARDVDLKRSKEKVNLMVTQGINSPKN